MQHPPPTLDEVEDPRYLAEQLVTCIGNKRALLDFIGAGLDHIQRRLGGRKLDILDAFSGSGVVSRYFKRFARRLVANDLELYADIANRCYLANASGLDLAALGHIHAGLLERLGEPGEEEAPAGAFIAELYAPRDDAKIGAGERVFYTRRNALYIDRARALIDELPPALQPFFLAPLLSEASIHANTAGVFKGFYKDARTGLGRFGGAGGDALGRIKGDIGLPFPLFSSFDCEVETLRAEASEAAKAAGEVDVAYLDPPYNQHPYGSNYFMLNLIAERRRPESVSEVSGIPEDWRRSDYNSRGRAARALEDLVAGLKAKFALISFNSEGFIDRREMEGLLGRHGRLTVRERDYSAFKGSRNLDARPLRVTEFLYILEKD